MSETRFVLNPKDRFSRDEAHIMKCANAKHKGTVL